MLAGFLERNNPQDLLWKSILSVSMYSTWLFGICIISFNVFLCATDVSVDVPDFLDLNRLRATGLQAGEEELPDLTPPIVIPEDTRGENH